MHQSHSGARVTLRLVTAALLVAVPVMAQALGLGHLTVQSALDEPLVGQIDLIDPSPQDLKTLKASLASREEFDIAGIERSPNLFDIKYTVSQRPNGQYYLKLTTDNAVREPFLHFLVQVEWSGGRLIREYSALLDPPHWVAGEPADVNVPVTSSSEPQAPVEAAAPAPVETLPPIGTTQAPEESAPAAPSDAAEAEKAQLAAGESAPAPTTPETTAVAPETQPTSAAPAPETAAAPTPEPASTASPVEPATTADQSAAIPEQPAATEGGAGPAVAAETAPAAPEAASAQEYGPVKAGETLSHVVRKVGTDRSLTAQQVMIALLRANPSAFYNNNVNIMKAGKILKLPEHEVIAAIPKAQADQEFRAQYDAWQEYKLKLAGSSRAVAIAESDQASKPATATGAKKTESKKLAKASKAEKASAAAKAQPVDLLKIVRANLEQDTSDETAKTPGVEAKKDAGQDKRVLTDRVATLEEAIESKQMQNKDMRERVGKLQEQVKNTERLIDLENKDLAKSQKQAAEKQVADAKLAEEKAEQEKAAQEKAAAVAAAAKAKPEAAKPVVPPKPVVPAVKPKVRAPVPAPQESFLDSLLSSVSDNSLVMAMLAGVGVLAAGVGGMYAFRRRRASREFSESILSGSSLTTDASITDPSGQAQASDTSFLSDFSQGGMGNIHTDEVDPIAEAEVYLAYGRDEQAEEILKDAIVKDPGRQELKGKLLEIYFQRNDTPAFETLAEELYAAIEGKGGKVWEKVEDMGRKLSPNNPMFSGGKPAARTAQVAAPTTMLMAEPAAAAGAASGDVNLASGLANQKLEFESVAPAAKSGLDFNMDFEPAPAKSASGSAMDMAFDLDTSAGAGAPARESAGSGLDMDFGLSAPAVPADSSLNLIDFSLPSMPEGASQAGAALDFTLDESATASGSNSIDFSSTSGDLSLGLGDTGEIALEAAAPADMGSEASPAGWDETATKLDLAKAYIDMGDAEGARSILDEVMAEGNDSQKKQARDLAAQIAA